MVRVKICGITNASDAQCALKWGADALGFIFAESPRRVSSQRVKAIVSAVGPWVATVGVFVNESVETMKRIAADCRLTAVQLHGEENAEAARSLSPLFVIKTFHASPALDLKKAGEYPADALLFDTAVQGLPGGTGKVFDWGLLAGSRLPARVIVSGGLKPSNVREAVERVRPYGVDVSSGVESAPGKKSADLIREFILSAKNA